MREQIKLSMQLFKSRSINVADSHHSLRYFENQPFI